MADTTGFNPDIRNNPTARLVNVRLSLPFGDGAAIRTQVMAGSTVESVLASRMDGVRPELYSIFVNGDRANLLTQVTGDSVISVTPKKNDNGAGNLAS